MSCQCLRTVDWETFHLRNAGWNGVVLFWLAKEFEHDCKRAYAQTSRFELGEWKVIHERDGSNLVVGIEEGFTGDRYIKRRLPQDCPEVPILSTLEETCEKAVELAYRRYDREFGRLLTEKYLKQDKRKIKLQHSIDVGEFSFKIASRIKERNLELDINPEFVGFLGYVHDIGYCVSPVRHELRTIDFLTEKESIPYSIARKTIHGQLAEEFGEKEGNIEQYLPIGLEGIILTYTDMIIRTGDPMSIEKRTEGVIDRCKRSAEASDDFKKRLIENISKALPRFKRYEQIVLALSGADSFHDF